MNYLAVAKVGILLFAEHIHTQYIGESGWSGQTWDWLMSTIGWSTSATLVDVVNKIWNVASNAVTIIKQAATEVLNAVKAGMEFIQNEIINAIIDGIALVGNSLMFSVVEIISSIFGYSSSTSSQGLPLIQINGQNIEIGLLSNEGTLDLIFGNYGLRFSEMFTAPDVETLSILTDPVTITTGAVSIVQALIIGLNLITKGLVTSKNPYANAAFIGNIVSTLLATFIAINTINSNHPERTDEMYEHLIALHLGITIGGLIHLLLFSSNYVYTNKPNDYLMNLLIPR